MVTPLATCSVARCGRPGRNGKANVDEYSPIYLPEEFKTDGDKYEGNLLYWAATLAGIIGSGALAIYLTSAL